jgi:hypothetical protein
MNGDLAAMRRMIGGHKYLTLPFPAIFLALLYFSVWAYFVGPDPMLWLLAAGGLAGLIPAVLNVVALWQAHRGLRDPAEPDRLDRGLRTASLAFRVGLVAWIVPLVVGFTLEATDDSDGVYLLGIGLALPIFLTVMNTHSTRDRLTRVRDAVLRLAVSPPQGG